MEVKEYGVVAERDSLERGGSRESASMWEGGVGLAARTALQPGGADDDVRGRLRGGGGPKCEDRRGGVFRVRGSECGA